MLRDLARGLGVFFLITACGPSVEEVVDVRVGTCGHDGPVRLKEHFFAVAASMVGERLVVGGFEVDPAQPLEELHSPVLHGMGPCGEDPVELLRGVLDVRVVGDLLLACDAAGHVDRIDPYGVRPPERLFERVSCRFGLTSAGLIAHDPVAEAIVVRPEPTRDGVQVLTLAEGVAETNASAQPFHVLDDHAYAVDTASRLLQMGGEETTIVATEVAGIELPARGDRLVVETRAVDDDGDLVDGPLQSWHPATGTTIGLELRMAWIDWPFAFGRRESDDAVPPPYEAIDLRDGSAVQPPSTGLQFWRPGPGRHLLFASGGASHEQTYWSWSEEKREWVNLGHYPGCSAASERGEHIEIYVRECSVAESWYADLGEVWLVDYDGRQRLGASGVSSNRFSTSDRVVWSVFSNDEELEGWFGELLVSEREDGERWRIDRDALLFTGWEPLDLGGEILYTVRDGGRSGLWRSALP